MTDIWEDCPLKERPNEEDYETTIPYQLEQFHVDSKLWAWLVNLKFQWNELKEKAELYDERIPILESIISDNQVVIDSMTDKLEAVKTHITHQNLSTYGLDLRNYDRVYINTKDFHAFTRDLKKILEGEDAILTGVLTHRFTSDKIKDGMVHLLSKKHFSSCSRCDNYERKYVIIIHVDTPTASLHCVRCGEMRMLDVKITRNDDGSIITTELRQFAPEEAEA